MTRAPVLSMAGPAGSSSGFSLLELLVAMSIAGMLLAGMAGIVAQVTEVQASTAERNALTSEARFAMQRMVQAVRQSRRLLLPLADNPATNWREHVREQTVPAGPPEGISLAASAVLAVIQSRAVDLDGDGFGDADNDLDGRFDEDPAADSNNDGYAGIFGIDDDGDGLIDESNKEDDDEDQAILVDEDPWNGFDDDGDGNVDEDPAADSNNDGYAGVFGIDDDGDGSIDESNKEDDDEDEDTASTKDEDGYDAVVFYLQGGSLVERTPVPWDQDGSGSIDGLDFVESIIAEHVTWFRVERVQKSSGELLVDLSLELTGEHDESVTLQTRVRVGGAP